MTEDEIKKCVDDALLYLQTAEVELCNGSEVLGLLKATQANRDASEALRSEVKMRVFEEVMGFEVEKA